MFAREFLIVLASAAVLVGCASSANEVKVPTMSMQDAYKIKPVQETQAAPSSRVVSAFVRPDQPLPVVSAPDVRMAYIYPNVDREGNMHYGTWVAIQVSSSKWIMPEGTPMQTQVPIAPAAK